MTFTHSAEVQQPEREGVVCAKGTGTGRRSSLTKLHKIYLNDADQVVGRRGGGGSN